MEFFANDDEMDSHDDFAAAAPSLDRLLESPSEIDALPSPPASSTATSRSASTSPTAAGEGNAVPLFWAVNASSVLLFLLCVLCACRRRGDRFVERWATARGPGGELSDLWYAREVAARRREEEEERRRENPEGRRGRLEGRFEERGVKMVVKESDFVGKPKVAKTAAGDAAAAVAFVEAGDGDRAAPAERSDGDDDIELGRAAGGVDGDGDGDIATAEEEGAVNAAGGAEGDAPAERSAADGGDIECGRADEDGGDGVGGDAANDGDGDGNFRNEDGRNCSGHSRAVSLDTATAPPAILLPAISSSDGGEILRPSRTVPNCCAVCLCPYEVDDVLIFSSNPECRHAFHSECIVEWLVKMQDGTPCPCCRREFVDLPDHDGARRKKLDPSDRRSSSTGTINTFDLGRVSWV